jgi:hypothetical protein
MKSPDEIKKGMHCCSEPGYNCNGCPYEDEPAISFCKVTRTKDALEYIQQLEAQVPRWISVEERLPEEGQKVAFIPSCNHGSVYVGVLSNIGKSGGVMFSHREGRYKSNYYAKYWMPMPEPPKEN